MLIYYRLSLDKHNLSLHITYVVTLLLQPLKFALVHFVVLRWIQTSELNVDNWNDNCEAKSEAKNPRPLRGLQVDFSLTRNVSYAVR